MSSIAPSSQSKIRLLIPPWLTGPWGILGLLLILHTLGFLIWIQFYGGGEEKLSTIASLATLPPILLHVLLAWRVAMQKQFDFDLRKAWFLLGLATLLSFVGDLTWAYLENVLHVEPFPSSADIFYMGSYALMLWGLFSMPGAPLKRQDRLTFWFNLLVSMITASMFVGYFVIIPTVSMHNTDLVAKVLAAAYPVCSLMILAGVLSILLRLPESDHRAVLLLLLAGVGFFLASDLAFGYTSLSGTYVSGGWIDAGWHIARVFMVLAALRQMDTRATPSARPRGIVPFNSLVKRLPLLAGLLGYGLVCAVVITDFSERVEWLFIAAALLTVLIIAHQIYIAGFSDTSVRTKLILSFLLVCVSAVELVSIFTYFALRAHPNSTMQVFFINALIVCVLTIGAAIFLAQRFVAPISRLTLVAQQIAAGNFSEKAEVESRDEIGILANTFNAMVDSLARTREELQENEALYHSLVDHSPDVITVYRNGRILFINPAGVKGLGAKNADELIGKEITDLLPLQDREQVRQGIEQIQTIKEATPLIQQTMHRLDGTSFESEFRAIPILYAGEPAVQFVMRDITERKRLEEQWQKFKLGIEQSTDAVFMTDVDGTIRYVNPAFEKLYGYFWDEAIGQTPRILKSGTLSLDDYRHFWETLLAKGSTSGELVNRTKDGRLIDIEGSASPILDNQGNLGFLSVHRDVTERKRAEEQIRQNAARAEALARVASILNSQLDLSAVAQAICEETARALTVPVVTVRLVNEHNDGLILVGQIGRKLEQVPAVVPLLRPAYEAIIQQPSALIMRPEWNQAENEKNAKLYAELNLRAGVHASIVHNGRMIGMLSLKTIGETREFTSDELDLIKGLADQAGLAISNAQLFAEVERRKSELEIRVEQRTAELNAVNQRLQEELAERQRLLKSLRDRERQLAQAVTLARIAYWELDLRTAEFTFNDQFYNVLRTTAHKVGGYSIPAERFLGQFVHPDDVDRLRERMRAAQASGSNTGQLEYRCICGDGQIQHALLEYQIVFDSPGHPSKIFAAHMDITERQQLFQSLRESEEHFRLLFEASPDAILLLDPNDPDTSWPIVDCNEVACKMNGYSRAELIGQSIDIFNLKKSTADEFSASLQRLRHEGVLYGIEAIHRHKDGHCFPIEYSTSLITLGDRELVLSIDHDITERKQVEEKLSQAKELAEAASRAKSDFLSRMSHELRTPMNAILGFAQLLEMSHKEPLSSNQKERVKQIVKGGQHLLDLINEILDISRIEANRLQISPEPVSVRDSINESVDLAVPLAVKRHVQVVTRLSRAEEHAFVMADRQRFKQVLLNLLSNAVKYNFDGGSVILTCQQRPSRKWRISIADTGPGIPQEQIGRLFQPFERLVSDESSVEGTGLGLALAKRLVELMHGQIGVDSAPGSGSTFWIELPATESPVEHLQRMGGTGELPFMSSTSQTILYVEDNVANFELIREVFADYSQIELLWAADPRSGIESALQNHPSLILLDLHFGDRDGSEVLQQLKHNEATAGIPVVIVSADATPRQAERLIALGAHAYLTKPLNVKHFIRLMEELLGEKAAK